MKKTAKNSIRHSIESPTDEINKSPIISPTLKANKFKFERQSSFDFKKKMSKGIGTVELERAERIGSEPKLDSSFHSDDGASQNLKEIIEEGDETKTENLSLNETDKTAQNDDNFDGSEYVEVVGDFINRHAHTSSIKHNNIATNNKTRKRSESDKLTIEINNNNVSTPGSTNKKLRSADSVSQKLELNIIEEANEDGDNTAFVPKKI
jgi:hypothetical protein